MKYAIPRLSAGSIDPLNIALIVFTCGLAHLYPYHLLIFSYAILGPAHYLTQISWLHDRRYFATSTLLMPVLGCLSLLLVALAFLVDDKNFVFAAATTSVALAIAFVFVMPARPLFRWLATAVGAFFILFVVWSPNAALLVAVLLPTILHVFVFTAAFMWAGAMKSGKIIGYATVFVLITGAATFLVPVSGTAPSLAGVTFFQSVVFTLHKLFGVSSATETQIFGFLSYAYTYHYLNWFSKAKVIRWNRIPKRRMSAIIMIYVIALAIYAFNYVLGFFIIFWLAQMHVLLEFPLNLRTLALIARRKASG